MTLRPSRSLLILALLAAPLACEEAEAPVAHVDSFKGGVGVNPKSGKTEKPASVNQGLFIDDIVSTGADGKATVMFAGGNRVELEANSSLVIHRGGGTLAEFGAELLSGHLQATAGKEGVHLIILSRGNAADLVTAGTLLDISVERGFEVKMGSTDIVRGGKKQTVRAGKRFTLDGVISEMGGNLDGVISEMGGNLDSLDGTTGAPKKKAKILEVTPMVFVMLAKPQQVQVMSAGQKTWHPAQKRTALKSGDRVRVKKGGISTRVQFPDESAVTLKGDSDVEFTEANRSVEGSLAGYQLHAGGMTVSLRRQEGKNIEHTLDVAGAKVKVEPTLRDANVQVETTRAGANLWVRNGQATVNDRRLEAGSMVEIAKGAIVGEVHPLAGTRIDIHQKGSTIIYYDKRVPALNFVWAEPSKKANVFEIGADRDFAQLICAENLSRGSYITDQLTAGKYYWRLDKENSSRGVVQIMEESGSDCANCKRTNVIDDTGEKTVVYFQQALPALVLRWKEVDGAANYDLKVFSDGEFDKPLFAEKVKDVKRAFESGRFPEGKYYWLIAALDDMGREMATGRMNSLQIAYDNAITALVIRNPRQGAAVAGGKLTTTGEVELGSKVFVNGKRVEVDDAGRFSEGVALKAGANQIIYRATSADGIERYYLRDVTRR